MASERWVEEVMKVAGYLPEYPGDEAVYFAANLLRRQHAAAVRVVKKCQCDPEDGAQVEAGYAQAKNDILAALATRKGGE